jgi:hypothetical protein
MSKKHFYKVHLWTRGTDNRMPVDDVEAEDRDDAAAMGPRYFAMCRFELKPELAHIDLENLEKVELEADIGEQGTVLITDVIAWLRQPERANFVKENELEPLLEAFDGR